MRSRMVAVAAVAGLTLAGCGADRSYQSIDTMGTNGEVGGIKVRNVYLEAPDGGNYKAGEDGRLRFRLINESTKDDELVDVRSQAVERARIRWDADCDGSFDTSAGLPIDAESTPLTDAYFAEVIGFDEVVPAGTTVPVTFEFRFAGTATIDAMVESRRDGEVEAPLSCTRADGLSK